MNQKNKLKIGSKYKSTLNLIVRITIDEILVCIDSNESNIEYQFNSSYNIIKNKMITDVNFPTSCYICLRRINDKPLVYSIPLENSLSYYFFHEKCFDELIKSYRK